MSEETKNMFDGYALFYKGEMYPINEHKFEWFSKVLNEWEEITPEEFDHMQAQGRHKQLRITKNSQPEAI